MKTLNKDLAAIQLNQVIEQLEDYDTEALVSIYNQYADAMRYERINDNGEHTINELYSSPYDALLAASYGDYNPNHDYFTYDGYNNLSSFNFTDDDNSPIDVNELAQWLIDEDKLVDYDITVTTLDDMLASIEDNITDDSNMFLELAKLLSLKVNSVEKAMTVLSDYNYKQLMIVINHLGINYE